MNAATYDLGTLSVRISCLFDFSDCSDGDVRLESGESSFFA